MEVLASSAEPRRAAELVRRRGCHEDLLTLVQVLDALVLQMVDAVPVTDRILQRTLEQVGGCDVEQLVEVPKLSTRTRMPARAFVLGL